MQIPLFSILEIKCSSSYSLARARAHIANVTERANDFHEEYLDTKSRVKGEECQKGHRTKNEAKTEWILDWRCIKFKGTKIYRNGPERKSERFFIKTLKIQEYTRTQG